MSQKTIHRGEAQAEQIQKALSKVTDIILNSGTIKEIEVAQAEAMTAGATDEEYSEAVWNARRTGQGMAP